MTEILTKAVWNGDTGETEVVPLTQEELAQRELDIAAAATAEEERLAAIAAEELAKADAIAELKALGLSDAAIAALTK